MAREAGAVCGHTACYGTCLNYSSPVVQLDADRIHVFAETKDAPKWHNLPGKPGQTACTFLHTLQPALSGVSSF